MMCFTVNPWGEVTPGIYMNYQEPPNSEPVLVPIFYNHKMEARPYGPNLYFHEFRSGTRRDFGIQSVKWVGEEDAYLIALNFWKPGERYPFTGNITPKAAFKVAEGICENHRVKMCELWRVNRAGSISSRNFKLQYSMKHGIAVIPLLGGQQE